MELVTGQLTASMSAASSFHVYPLQAQVAKAGTLKTGKKLLKFPELPVRREEAWQSSSSSWPMSVAACRSRCRPRPPPRNCAPASPMPATTSSRVRARSGFGGLSRRKVKLEPFLIFNQQFLTLIRAGLPILGSLRMLGKIQKNAQFRRAVGRRLHPRQDRRIALGGLRGAERFPDHVHHHPAGRRTLRQPAGGAGALRQLPERLAHLPQEADRLAHLSGAAADAGHRADDLPVHRGGSAVCSALRPDGLQAARP